jgi:two-component system, LuxR family, sensor kinase FixL
MLWRATTGREAARVRAEPLSPRLSAVALPPILAGLFAIGIFVVDTFIELSGAVAVLYVVVVLVAARHFPRRGVLLVTGACLGLTVLSYALQHRFAINAAFVRCIMSLAAIVITTFLALRNQAANAVLRERAELLDLTHDTILVRDMNDVVTYWNRGAEELYGFSQPEAVGKIGHELLQTVFPAPLAAINAELLRAGRWEGELLHTKRDGARVTVSSRWSLQRDNRGQAAAILETNTDITERKRADQELRASEAQLAHVTRVTTLGELAASIAHEVNQPLAAIVTNGEAGLRWLGHATPNTEEARRSLKRIVSDAERASQVIKRIRNLSRKADPEKTPLDINDVVDDVIPLVQRAAFGHRTALHRRLAAGLPPVLGDRVQLQQVVINLIVNGIEAMADIADRPREIVIRSRRDESGEVLVEIEDAGTGIDPAQAARLFNAFYTTKRDGMGMGLSICRSIIEAHGGRIAARPNAPHGAVFQVALPAAS